MDALTAATAMMAVQLSVALVMAGTFYASSGERCTRYWALSGLLSATGVLIVILNAGASKLALSTMGNTAVIAGMVLQWWGVRAFYGRKRSIMGWLIIVGFFILFSRSLWLDEPLRNRALLSSVTMALVFFLNLFELWNKRSPRTSFAGMLAFVAALASAVAFITRAVAVFRDNPQFLPDTAAGAGVVIVYLIPMASTLLFAMALMLLYFERLVADKHQMATQDELTGLYNRRAIVALSSPLIQSGLPSFQIRQWPRKAMPLALAKSTSASACWNRGGPRSGRSGPNFRAKSLVRMRAWSR